MNLIETLKPIGHGHAGPPQFFVEDIINWARGEDSAIFAPNPHLGDKDIYNVLRPKFWPWISAIYRRAVGCEFLRVLSGDESDWNWKEGRDTTAGHQTLDQMEAGAFQVSNDSRWLSSDLDQFLMNQGISTGQQFQDRIKADPHLDMAYTFRLCRDATRWDGPINRGWVITQMQMKAVQEFQSLLL